MKLNASLEGANRIGSIVIGAGVAGFALLGNIEEAWLRVLMVVLGIAFMTGGLVGT